MNQARTQPVQALLVVGQGAGHAPPQLFFLAIQLMQQAVPVRADQFSRCRGSRGTQVGGEVGNGEVGFVADA